MESSETAPTARRSLPAYAWFGLILVSIAWWLNWSLGGLRTHWAFFPLWFGYCLTVDGLVFVRSGSSLVKRSIPRFAGLFAISAPAWWLFELLNLRSQNWIYLGVAAFSPAAYAFWTTLNFSTVMPAVFETAELMAALGFLGRLPKGPRIEPGRRTTLAFFLAGWLGLGLLLAWPKVFFPLIWLSIFFILEPVNIRLGHASISVWTRQGDWRPVLALWTGVLLTAFFWEMWNYASFPKWVYSVPWGDWLHIFEMPILGYGGYLPFALELFALYNLVTGMAGNPRADYVRLINQQ